jgi:hypothetical protein
MPITVKELNISANVSGNSGTTSSKPAAGGGGMGKLDKEIIIREAVRRVMEELSYKMGR